MDKKERARKVLSFLISYFSLIFYLCDQVLSSQLILTSFLSRLIYHL